MAEFMDGLFGSRHALPAEVPPIDNDTLLYVSLLLNYYYQYLCYCATNVNKVIYF